MPRSVQAQIEQFELPHSDGKSRYQISVYRPEGVPAGSKDIPILFLLDSDMHFGVAAEIARERAIGGMFPSVAVVGIGYGADFLEVAKLRTADMTPPMSDAASDALGNLKSFIGTQSGGADAFLAFIVDVLRPELIRLYPELSAANSMLFGHSLGGLFCAYALLGRPDAFSVFLSSSPSLWWDGFAIMTRIPGFAERLKGLAVPPRAFIDVGAREQDVPTEVPPVVNMSLAELQTLVAVSRMVDGAREFADALRKTGLKDVEYVAFQDEDHRSVVPAAITRALGFALLPRK
jgi:predicted alpha/beta superfamily hydrolase